MSKVMVFTQFGSPRHQKIIDRELTRHGASEVAIPVKAAGGSERCRLEDPCWANGSALKAPDADGLGALRKSNRDQRRRRRAGCWRQDPNLCG